MTKSIIELNNVKKSYAENHVLKGINGEVHEGEVICIIGPSGSERVPY